MQRARSLGIAIIWDAVLNHKTAGDTTEECWAVEVDPSGESRLKTAVARVSHASRFPFFFFLPLLLLQSLP